MRVAFTKAVMAAAAEMPDLLFLSGDLGFNAFEDLSAQLGPRFLNTGVAEQMAVGLAAGLAHAGHRVLWYSIAPFAVFRPLEQIRLDVSAHRLPVCVVGNGGGYGYGIMGGTHHALEDLACLTPMLEAYIPAYDDDVEVALRAILENRRPAYLRLGAGPTRGVPSQLGLERIRSGDSLTAVALGPMVHPLTQACEGLDVDLWVCNRLPVPDFELCLASLARTGKLLVVEEHSRRGGLAEYLSLELLRRGCAPTRLESCHAQGYPNGRYGSQNYHRQVNGLDAVSLRHRMLEMLS